MMKLNKNEKIFFSVCGVLIVALIVLIAVVSGLNNGRRNNNLTGQHLLLNNKGSLDDKTSVDGGRFFDTACGISFEVPDGMTKSSTLLPLPQEPLSQVVFDDGENKSVLSYICYDGKYTFDQFNGDSDLQTKVLTAGGKNFSRIGNFVYFNKGDKLVIFQMFFTKNDLNPKSGYEEKLQKLLGSVS